jgi:cytochrome-b5 reductase
MKKNIGMLAGGTGITPMYQVGFIFKNKSCSHTSQVLQKILSNPDDHTEVRLIFCNKTEDDILLKHELDALSEKYDNFKVCCLRCY